MLRRSPLLLLGGLLAAGALVPLLGSRGAGPWGHATPCPVSDAGSRRHDGPRPDVVLVVLDGLRADAVRAQADGAGPLPALQTRAGHARSYQAAYAAAPDPRASLASLLTGRLPQDHGVGLAEDGPGRLRSVPTLAALLAAAGYRTHAWVPRRLGTGPGSLLEGFSQVRPGVALADVPAEVARLGAAPEAAAAPRLLLLASDELAPPWRGAAAAGPAAEGPGAAAVLRRFALDAPDASGAAAAAPQPSAAERRRLERALALPLVGPESEPLAEELGQAYRAHLERLDGVLERALAALGSLGGSRDTLLVVTSTTGMALGERGWFLEAEVLIPARLHVPLLLSGPGPLAAPGSVRGAVSLLDVTPTVLDLLALPALEEAAGRSLLAPEPEDGRARAVACQARRTFHDGVTGVDVLSSGVVGDGHLYVLAYDRLAGTVLEEGYDLAADPSASRNLADGAGRVGHLPVGRGFCSLVEQARDHVFGAVAGTAFMLENGYLAGAAYVQVERPPRICAAEDPR